MNFIKSAKGKLITIVLTFMLLFNFIMPKYTYAAGTGPWVGLLVEPITDLVCSISDAILNTMQKLMVPGAPRAVAIRNGWDMDAIKDGDLSLADLTVNHVGRYLSGNLDPVSGAITTAIAGGIPGAIVAAVAGGPITWGAIAGAAIVGGIALLVDSIGGSWLDNLFQNQAYPIIYYSPAAIFSNRIPALDVNFLNPASNFDQQYQLLLAIAGTDKKDYTTTMRDALVLTEEEAIDNWNLAQKIKEAYDAGPGEARNQYLRENLAYKEPTNTESEEDNTGSEEPTSEDTSSPDSSEGSLETAGNPAANSAVILGPTISKWYIALRNLAIVGLLIVLVYIAIRIVLSSISDEKAKYKIMLKDWVIALLLIFFIHYIMLGMLTVVDSVTRMLDNITFKSTTIEDKDGNSMGDTEYTVLTDQLFSQVRWQQSIYRNSSGDSETAYLDAFGYAVMYATLVMYTLYFTVRYIKRVVYMAFLTIISPMVALTYPIDKVGDKKAQAFDTWFREYLYNLIIQPIHLLIYIVLVSSALEFAITNPLYGIVAIGFMLEAEKFIKMLFGVKGKNGALGTFATAAVLTQGIGALESASSAVANRINPKQPSADDNATIWQKQLGEGLEKPASLSDKEDDEIVTVQPETGTTPNVPNGGSAIPILKTTPEQEKGQAQAQGQGQAQEQGQTIAIPVPVEVPVAENEERKPRISGFSNGMRNVFGTNKDRLVNSDIHKKAAAMATNAGLRGLGIGTLGTLGLAAGLATDGKTLPVVLGAMAAGNAIGGSAAKIGINSAGAISQKAKDAGERYNSNGKPTQRQIQAFLKDSNQRTLYRNTFGPRDYQRKMQQRVQLAENGLALRSLSEDNDGKIAMKWMDEGIGAREATALVKIGREDIQRKHLMDPSSKEYNNLENRIKVATNDPHKREQMMEKIMEVNRVDPEEVRKTKKSKQLVSSDIEEQGREKQKKMQEKFQQKTVNGQEQNDKDTKPEKDSETPRSNNKPREQGDHSTTRADVNNQNEKTAENLREEAETKAQVESDEQKAKERETTLLEEDAQQEPQDDQDQ